MTKQQRLLIETMAWERRIQVDFDDHAKAQSIIDWLKTRAIRRPTRFKSGNSALPPTDQESYRIRKRRNQGTGRRSALSPSAVEAELDGASRKDEERVDLRRQESAAWRQRHAGAQSPALSKTGARGGEPGRNELLRHYKTFPVA
jgi:hypothetical protein